MDGLVCVPEGSVECDMQAYIAEEVGIIRNVMDCLLYTSDAADE